MTSASRIFAEKSVQEATIAEICEQAQTNIASVNDHFRGKESQYLESWRFAFNHELTRHPPDGGVAGDAAPEQRLAGRIHARLTAPLITKSMRLQSPIKKWPVRPACFRTFWKRQSTRNA